MSGKSKGLLAAVALLALAIFVAGGLGLFGKPSDEEQIRTALQRAVEASREGRPGGVLELLSAELTVNEVQYPTRQVSQFIRERKPSVKVLNLQPQIKGESATIVSPVKLNVLTFERTIPDVTLHFEQVEAKRWFVFPAKDWKLARVQLSESTLNEIASTFGGY